VQLLQAEVQPPLLALRRRARALLLLVRVLHVASASTGRQRDAWQVCGRVAVWWSASVDGWQRRSTHSLVGTAPGPLSSAAQHTTHALSSGSLSCSQASSTTSSSSGSMICVWEDMAGCSGCARFACDSGAAAAAAVRSTPFTSLLGQEGKRLRARERPWGGDVQARRGARVEHSNSSP
jgi:hypothetical protein